MARILVIDDEADTRTLLEDWLASAGHQVVSASDGKEGMKQFRATPPDLVITDLFMPNQDGVETIRELHRDFPDVPLIAMSGNVIAEPLLLVASRLGATEVLYKPFYTHELLSAVERALHKGTKTAFQPT